MIISVPAILTANPLGSVIAHATMHITADAHAYETNVYLPPQTFVNAGPSSPPSEIQLSDADSGANVFLANSGTLIVALVSNASTGYHWIVEGDAPRQLEQQGEPRYAPPGSTAPVLGAPGSEIFTFKAVEKGTAPLKLAYLRAGEAQPASTFSVVVSIR